MEVKWFVEDEKTKAYLINQEDILTIDEAIQYEPHIVLTATDYVADFISGIKVQIFHGFPANKRKGTDQFIIRNFFDLYCTQGATSTANFKKKSKKLRHFEVVETGWPKMDALFPLKDKPTNDKPIIMVSSTFTKKYSLALNGELQEELKRLSKIGKWHFNIVLHPLISKEIVAKFKSFQNENLTYYDTTNLIPLFEQSDIMLCDTSSALIEYLLQIKPVVTFKNNMPLQSYINVNEVDKIEEAIQYALSRPDEIISEIKKYADDSHTFKDGKSSKRVIDASLNFLYQDKTNLKSKPLSFVRKYKIRKKLNYWTWKSYRKPITIAANMFERKF